MQWWEAIRWERQMLGNMTLGARRLMDTHLPKNEHLELVIGALWNMGENHPAVDGQQQWQEISTLIEGSVELREATDLLTSAMQKADALAQGGAGNDVSTSFGVEGTRKWTCCSCGRSVVHKEVYLSLPGPCKVNSLGGFLRFEAHEILFPADWNALRMANGSVRTKKKSSRNGYSKPRALSC